jgi:hypothetical protein
MQLVDPDKEARENATDVQAFLTRFRRMSSDSILSALSDIGWTADRFAKELARLYETTEDTGYRARLMELFYKIVSNAEAQKIAVESLERMSEKAVREIAVEIVQNQEKAGIDMTTARKLLNAPQA